MIKKLNKNNAIAALEKILASTVITSYSQFDGPQEKRIDEAFPLEARVLREIIYGVEAEEE